MIALVPVAPRVPWLLFAIPAGIVTDRVDRLRLIRAMDVLRGLAFAVAAAAIWAALPLAPAPASGVSPPWLHALIIVAALMVGGAEMFRDNAAQTLLRSLVPGAGLERANGRRWSVELVANSLIGPVVGAFLIGAALTLPFAVNAAAYGGAFVLLAGLPGQFRPVRATERNWRCELAEGLAYLKMRRCCGHWR